MKKTALLLNILLILNITQAQNPLILQMVNKVRSDSLWSYITTLSSQQRFTYATADTVCRHWLRSFFEQAGFDTVYYQYFSTGHMPNVVAEIRGVSAPDSICILGAHHDVYTWSAPGADDNASGTAGVIEVARALAPNHFRKTIRFVCFAAEETGGQGSHNYVQHSVNVGENNFSMVNLDMISHSATGSGPPVSYVAYNANSQALFQRMDQVMENYVPGAGWIDGSSFPYASASDHASFWDAGIPAIFLNDCLDPDSPDFNHFFHTSSDVVGVSVNNQPLAEAIARTAAALIAEIAIPAGAGPASVGESGADFSIFPNPVSDYFIIRSKMGLPGMSIVDVFGRIRIRISPAHGSETMVPVGNLEPGIYFVLFDGDETPAKKLLIR